MENNGRLLPGNGSLVEEVPANKPLSGRRSKFFVSTARREILGGPIHRTELPPSLQGFFYGDGDSDEEEYREDRYLPCKNYGRFASLLPGAAAAATSVDVDPSLSFLSKAVPGNRHVFLIDSCNGLLLLGHVPESYSWPEFAVCNPATQQWVAVPTCVDWVDDDLRTDPRNFTWQTHISLIFDPAVSSHFQVLLFWNCHVIDDEIGERTTTVHAYSSETGVWRNSESHWSPEDRQDPCEMWRRQIRFDRFDLEQYPGAFVDGMLYLILGWSQRIIQVDMEGKTQCILRVPAEKADAGNRVVFVGQSQGRLHCIVEEGNGCLQGQRSSRRRRYRKKSVSDGLSIWVHVGDSMDSYEWVMKHKVKRRQLFGNRLRKWDGFHDYRVVTMHPDCDMVFFLVHRADDDYQMVSYDFNRGEARVVDTYKHHASDKIIPFVPYLSELFVGVLGAHK